MALDTALSSPHRRSHNSGFTSPTFRKQLQRDDPESWSALFRRHRFLLTALLLLACLCTVYLYFAVTLGAGGPCAGLTEAEKASCQLQKAKSSMANGKLKIF